MNDIMALRPSGLGSLTHALRLGIAVTLSWLIATLFSHNTSGLFAPITTLLVVQSSPLSTLSLSVQRVLGTGIGVLLASIWVNAVGLSWWSFLIAVLVSLVIARKLPWSLTGQLQIPVAVVFVLAMGPMNMRQDLWRVIDVVIGGVVGLIAVYVYPPRPKPGPLLAALDSYRDAVIKTVAEIARGCGIEPKPLPDGEDHAFVLSSRGLRLHADSARDALMTYASSAMLNPRGRIARDGLAADVERLRALMSFALQVRGLAGAANRLYDRSIHAALPVEDFRSLLEQLGSLATLVFATDQDEPTRAKTLDLAADLAAATRACAQRVLAQHAQVSEVMESLGVLTRIDYLQQQLMLIAGRALEA